MSRWKKDDASDHALYMREWANTDAGKEYRKKHAEYMKEYRKNNRQQMVAVQKSNYQRVRLEALQHYSGKTVPECRCCGETIIDFLHLDHVNGDGAAQRKQINNTTDQKNKKNVGGNGFVYWLKRNNWPEGIQVLCANCNLGKFVGKYCPHELHRGIDMNGNPISVQ